jgi:hypothetical protein
VESREHHAQFIIPPRSLLPIDLMIARNAHHSCRVHVAITSLTKHDPEKCEAVFREDHAQKTWTSAAGIWRKQTSVIVCACLIPGRTHDEDFYLNTWLRPQRVPCRGCGVYAVGCAD